MLSNAGVKFSNQIDLLSVDARRRKRLKNPDHEVNCAAVFIY